MAKSFLHPLALCLVLLSGYCLASRQSSPVSQQAECDLQSINPLEPGKRIEHEAGYTEFWDENNRQLKCVGVTATRHVLQTKGLLVPSYNNAPSMAFVLQGHGSLGLVFPGCPETFQSFQQGQQGSQSQDPSFRDQHQKIHLLRPGDVAIIPAGVAHWAYNEADEDLVLLVIHDISNRENQLDQNLRRFFLAGNQQGQQGPFQPGQKSFWTNIFHQVEPELYAQAFGVREELLRKLQNQEDARGFIVRVEEGLRFVRPGGSYQEEQQGEGNGYEETICTLRIKENLFNPDRTDIYTARGGSVSTLNSYNLNILRNLRLSAGRGHLHPNAMIAPYWNIGSHSISFVVKGSGRLHAVGNSKRPAYDGEIRQGQLFVIPQNFVHMKQAGQEGLEWVTLKTNDKAKSSPLVGKTGVFRGVPLDVWIHAHRLTHEEARALKFNRDEVTVLDPQFSSQSQQHQGSSPWSIE